MPFRFLFGGKRQTNEEQPPQELDDISDGESVADITFLDDVVNEVYIMNQTYDSAGFRSPTISPSPFHNFSRQHTRTMSSRMREREHTRVPSMDPSEYGIDVELAPSAFALHTMPSGLGRSSVCSRDDSEIATRTKGDRSLSISRCCSPYANALYLSNYSFNDDSEVGSCTLEKKIPLRHLGSALSYRLSISGTPDFSVYDDEESTTAGARRGHSRTFSDMSEKMQSFRKRNPMITLESVVGGMQKQDNSVFEFGIVNADSFGILQSQPTPRLFRSHSDKQAQYQSEGQVERLPAAPIAVSAANSNVQSFPISFLTDIVEEDEDDMSSVDRRASLDKNKTINSSVQKAIQDSPDNKAEKEGEISDPESPSRIHHSSFTVTLSPFEMANCGGYTNPAFEDTIEAESETPERQSAKRQVLRLESVKRSQSRKDRKSSSGSVSISRKHEKRDEALHVALMERYLLQSVVNKYFNE